MLNLDKLAEVLTRNFSEPFLDKGIVDVKIRKWKGEKYLKIRILNRDIDIDENLDVISSGTNVEEYRDKKLI